MQPTFRHAKRIKKLAIEVVEISSRGSCENRYAPNCGIFELFQEFNVYSVLCQCCPMLSLVGLAYSRCSCRKVGAVKCPKSNIPLYSKHQIATSGLQKAVFQSWVYSISRHCNNYSTISFIDGPYRYAL